MLTTLFGIHMVSTRLQSQKRQLEMDQVDVTYDQTQSATRDESGTEGSNSSTVKIGHTSSAPRTGQEGDQPARPSSARQVAPPGPKRVKVNVESSPVRTRPPTCQPAKEKHDCFNRDVHEIFIHIRRPADGQISAVQTPPGIPTPSVPPDFFRFRCPLGDVWHDAYADVCRHRNVKTGDVYVDKIIRNLPFQGYDIAYVVGRGRFSQVIGGHSVHHATVIAMKVLRQDQRKGHSPLAIPKMAPWQVDYPEEVEVHRQLNHRNIVKWIDYMTIQTRRCIVLEMCHNGSIDYLLSKAPGGFLSETVARKYFRGMTDALDYLHSKGFVHRDVNCSNWLVSRCDVIKLCDFGDARRWTDTDPLMQDVAPGDPGYQPPEALQDGALYNPRIADVWSLGVSLYKMVTSRMPFTSNPKFQPGRCRHLVFPRVIRMSSEICDLLSGLLCVTLGKRYTLNRTRYSPWFVNDDTKLYIGVFYQVRQPQKIKEGPTERRWKYPAGLVRAPPIHEAWTPTRGSARHSKISRSSKTYNFKQREMKERVPVVSPTNHGTHSQSETSSVSNQEHDTEPEYTQQQTDAQQQQQPPPVQ